MKNRSANIVTMKYLLAYILPLSTILGLLEGGWMLWSTPLIAFVIVPIIESFFHGNTAAPRPLSGPFAFIYDVFAFFQLPFMYVALWLYFSSDVMLTIGSVDWLGATFSVGILLGAFGMNLGHEFGHRATWYYQLIAHLFWLPNLYMHFGIEHNIWHHKYVATDKDTASAPEGMSIYTFWRTSVIGNFRTAWKVENMRLERGGAGLPFNKMYMLLAVEGLYLIGICLLFGLIAGFSAVVVAIIGFLLLESVNYIEHYGLRRQKLPNGRYEPQSAAHSWNSNHDIGRIILYELTRHSDHHLHTSKRYEMLESIEGCPTLPYGYPTSILMALIPSVWKARMGHEIAKLKA